jgi:rare lipoprotein A
MLNRALTMVFLASAVSLAGCSSSTPELTPKYNSKGESLAGFEGKGSPYFSGSGPIPKGGGRYHVGKAYSVAGMRFTPQEQPDYDKTGVASWYGEAFHRRKTSNGEYFDMNDMTAAHPTLPLPSYARVTNLENGKTIVVRINDRGPFVGTRIIDLSKRSADALEFRGKGKADVRVQWIGNAPLNDQGGHLAMMNRKAASGASMRTLIAAVDGPTRSDEMQVALAAPKRAAYLQQASYQKPATYDNAERIVQVGAFGSLDEAENARARLGLIGPVQVYEWDSVEGPIYKVQVGPFKSDIGAQEALQAVKSEGYNKAKITKVQIEDVAWKN